MFQFPGFALKTLCIQVISTWLTQLLIPKGNNNRVSGGFPHSEIHGSKLILSSPWLIAEYHVLHRLLLPRHPPNALIALDLIRKKKDPQGPSIPRPFALRGGRFRSKACTFPALSEERTLLLRRRSMVSVLDLDNAVAGPAPKDGSRRSPTWLQPTTPIISLNDVKCVPCTRVRQDEKAAIRFLIMSGFPSRPSPASSPEHSPRTGLRRKGRW